MKKRRHDLRLQECFLYAIDSPKDLARRLSSKRNMISPDDLHRLSFDALNFKFFKIKERAIQEPKARLQGIHKRVHRLLSRAAVPAYLHSAVSGRTYLSNAKSHDASVPTFKVDIKKFFASVPERAVIRFLRNDCRCRSDVARMFARILVCNGKIATGSSASPILSYYAFKPMFDEIAALADQLGLTFTCYVDDMTFSGPAATNATLMRVREIIARHGLQSHKTRSFKANQPKVVTGVCLTPNGPRVPNRLHLKIAKGFEAVEQARNHREKQTAQASLLGCNQAAGTIEPKFKARAITLRSEINAARA